MANYNNFQIISIGINSYLQIVFYMLQNKANQFASDYQLELCIERALPESEQVIAKNLSEYCTQLMRRHQLNLSYSNEELTNDLLVLFTKINAYSEIVQNLLFGFKPCKKLGKVIETLSFNCEKIFRFLKIHMQQKKNYTQQRLKYLQQKFESQAPGRCSRCKKFVLTRDIEETKILLTAGQFNDPFDLYDMGSSDFVNIRLKEDDEEYRLRFAEVWENKKKIEEKFHMMQLELDKRAYGCNYSVGEIQKIQDIIKGIVEEISSNDYLNLNAEHKSFDKNMSELINNIYKKLRDFKLKENYKEEGVQVGEVEESQMIQEMKQINEKIIKKNKDLAKKLTAKQRQMTDLSKKVENIQKQLVLSGLEKDSYQTAVKNLLSKQVQYEKQIYNESSNAKGYFKKVQQLEKQIETLKAQILKLYSQLETRKSEQKAGKSAFKSFKSINSKKILKNSKYDINETEKQTIKRGQSIKENRRVSLLLHQNKKTASDLSSNSQEKQKKDENFEESMKPSKKHIEFVTSQSKIKQTVEIKVQTSLSAHRVPGQDIGEPTDFPSQQHTQISIQIRKTQKNLEFMRSTSTKRIKNGTISLKRIKKKISLVEKQQNQDQIGREQGAEQVLQGIENKEEEIVEEGQIIKKSSKSKQNKVYFKSQFEKKPSRSKKKISQHESLNQHQNDEIRLNKSRKKSSKFHSLYTSKTQQQSQNRPKNSAQLEKITKNSIRKPINQVNLQSFLKKQQKTQEAELGNTHLQKIENKAEQDSMHSTLPNIFNTEKLKKIKIDDDKENEVKGLQPYIQLYGFYKKLAVDQQNEQSPVETKKLFQFQHFRKCVENFVKFLSKLSSISLKSQPYYLPSYIPEVSLHQKTISRTSAHKHESLHSTSTHNLSGSSTRQWKNKIQYWKWAGGDSIKSRWARRHVNMSTLNNTYSGQDTTQQQSQLSMLQITQIKTKIGKLYFSSQDAYQLQKSHPTSMVANLNFSLSNLKNTKNFSKAPVQLANILSKYEIKYLKLITILLARLHDKNIQVYEAVKKSIMFPFSFLGNGLVMTSIQMKKIKKQRKTVGGSPLIDQTQNTPPINDSALISESIIKLIVLHRKCLKTKPQLPSAQNQNPKQMKQSCSSMGLYQKTVCKHLNQFLQQIQKQFGKATQEQNPQSKLQQFNQTDMAKHYC